MLENIPEYIFLDSYTILHKNGFIFDILTSHVLYPIHFHSITYKGKLVNMVKFMILHFYNISLTEEQYINIKYKDNDIHNISLENLSLENINLPLPKDKKYHIDYSYNMNIIHHLFILYKYDHNNKLLKCYNKLDKLQVIILNKADFIKQLLLCKTIKCQKYIWKIDFKKIALTNEIDKNPNYIYIYDHYYLSYDNSHIISKITKKLLTINVDVLNHFVYLTKYKKKIKFILNYYSHPNLYETSTNLNTSCKLHIDNFYPNKKIKLNNYHDNYTINDYFNEINENNSFDDIFKININDNLEESFNNTLYYQIKNNFLKNTFISN